MAAVNFPDPSASPWTNPANGITYKYDSGVWTAVTSGNTLDDRYVRLDDEGTKQVIKSGGLGISDGTDEKITLGADGSVTAGNTYLNTAGYAMVISDGVDNQAMYYAGSGLYIGNSGSNALVGTSNIQLTEDGSGSFSGNVTAGGAVSINTSATPGANIKLLLDNGRSLFQADDEVYGLGLAYNAETAPMYLGSPSVNEFQVSYPSGTPALKVGVNGIEGYVGNAGLKALDIDSTGAATFAGEIISGNAFNAGNGSWMYPTGLIGVRNDAAGAQVFQVLAGGSTPDKETVKITAAGSATFSSTVRINHPNGSYWAADGDTMTMGDTAARMTITASGSLFAYKQVQGGTIQANGGFDSNGKHFIGVTGGVENFTVSATGKVTALGGFNISAFQVLPA